MNGRKHGFETHEFRYEKSYEGYSGYTEYNLYLDGNFVVGVLGEEYPFRKVEGPDETGKGQVDLRAWDGSVRGGPYVNGKRHGNWIDVLSSWRSGLPEKDCFDSWEGRFVQGKRQGQWVYRSPSGYVVDVSFVDGKKHGKWIERDSTGTVLVEIAYVDDKKHGDAVARNVDGSLKYKGAYADGKKLGYWVESEPNGDVSEGEYTESDDWLNDKNGRWLIRHRDGYKSYLEYSRGQRKGIWYKWVGNRCWRFDYRRENPKDKKVSQKFCR